MSLAARTRTTDSATSVGFVWDHELGWGRLTDGGASIRFFDSPARPEAVIDARNRRWTPGVLPEQARAWWFDGERWLVGRIYTPTDEALGSYIIQFPNGQMERVRTEQVRVRWSKPLSHPLDMLVAGTVETRFFHSHRTSFLRHVTEQRSASMGLRGLLSSAVELHDHQLGAARRVLADPVRRYLLADEVGLGKTIEAGMVLRQLLLDQGPGGKEALVVVPDTLVGQWRQELRSKFRAHLLRSPVRIVGHSRILELPVLPRVLAVVDEAHRLTEGVVGHPRDERRRLYDALDAICQATDALLLLSATPVRSNEDGFLGLLHLLDPGNYRLEDLAGFRRRVEIRDTLAETLTAIGPDTPLRYLDEPLARLEGLLSSDATVAARVAEIRGCIVTRNESAVRRSIAALRNHVAEAYRIHRRLIRNRRSQAVKAGFPARGRGRSVPWRLADPDDRRRRVFDALEDFRLDIEASSDLGEGMAGRALQTVLGRVLAPVEALRDLVAAARGLDEHDLSGEEMLALGGVLDAAPGRRLAHALEQILLTPALRDRAALAAEWAEPRIGGKRKYAVVCSFPRTAGVVADVLVQRFGRHRITALTEGQSEDERSGLVTSFARSRERSVLVLDRSAEEGTNLQFVDEVLHLTLPVSTSQLEQRLGRFDRWGELWQPVRSTVVAEADSELDRHLGAWRILVDHTFGVFIASTATLQYVLADLEREFFDLSVTDTFAGALEMIQSKAVSLEEQRRRITGQDVLDSIEDRADDVELGRRLSTVDKGASEFERAVRGYLVTMLKFSEFSEEKGIIRFGISKRQPPLLPEPEVMRLGPRVFDLAYTSDRLEAASGSGRGLLRWGEPLVDAFADLAEVDDRGRAFAVEVVKPHLNPDDDPLVVFCFDFIVAAGLSGTDDDFARAVAARTSALLPITVERVWWTPGRGECPPHVVADLERQDAVGRPMGTNLGSRPERFRELTAHLDWRRSCEDAFSQAMDHVRTRIWVLRRLEAARTQALLAADRERAILAVRGEGSENDAAAVRLLSAVQVAVETPTFTLDSCGAVIITWGPRQ
jgi:ATP-dependent helicase HepA